MVWIDERINVLTEYELWRNPVLERVEVTGEEEERERKEWEVEATGGEIGLQVQTRDECNFINDQSDQTWNGDKLQWVVSLVSQT